MASSLQVDSTHDHEIGSFEHEPFQLSDQRDRCPFHAYSMSIESSFILLPKEGLPKEMLSSDIETTSRRTSSFKIDNGEQNRRCIAKRR